MASIDKPEFKVAVCPPVHKPKLELNPDDSGSEARSPRSLCLASGPRRSAGSTPRCLPTRLLKTRTSEEKLQGRLERVRCSCWKKSVSSTSTKQLYWTVPGCACHSAAPHGKAPVRRPAQLKSAPGLAV